MTQAKHTSPGNILLSPLPGRIVSILAHEGEHVEKDQRVFIVESMKMFHELRAPKRGKMTGIAFRVGDAVLPINQLASIV